MAISPRRLLHSLLLVGLLAVAVGGARVALANAPSLDVLSSQAFVPSTTPGLLGPITEVGRVGWACHPEQAAGASRWMAAELPDPR